MFRCFSFIIDIKQPEIILSEQWKYEEFDISDLLSIWTFASTENNRVSYSHVIDDWPACLWNHHVTMMRAKNSRKWGLEKTLQLDTISKKGNNIHLTFH